MLERQREHRSRLDSHDREIDCRCQQLEDGERKQFEHALRFLVEPRGLRLERVDGLAPETWLDRSLYGAAWTFVLDGLPREDCHQCRRSEATEQEPRHTAYAQPAKGCKGEGRGKSELNRTTRLRGDPRRDGVDQLAVEENHLEEHYRALDNEHLYYSSRLLRLDCFSHDLHAGEASRHQHEQEHPQQPRHHARVRIEPGEPAEYFIARRLQCQGKDRRFDGAPNREYHEREPWHTRLEVALGGPVEQRQRRAKQAEEDVLDHQESKAYRADDPADERHTDAKHSSPEQPDAAARIPPCHEH